MASQFRDTAGRSWHVDVTIASVRRAKQLTGVDLTNPGEAFEALTDDVLLMVDVLYALVKDQADAAGISDEQFGQALGGDSLEHAADALMEGLADFFPKSKRAVLMRAADKAREYRQKIDSQVMAKLESGEVDRVIDKAIEDAFGNPSGGSPASLGSIPAP